MSAQKRRIILWNEAKLDPFFEESILDIMQGKTIEVNHSKLQKM